MKVLVVENSTGQPSSLTQGLQAFGYSVDSAGNEVEAVKAAGERRYDIIILDLMLPRESSLLVLHEIRESDHDIEILILSSQDQIHDRVTALIQGATDYLVKPFSFAELHTRIQELLRHKVSPSATTSTPGRESRDFEHTNRLIANLLENCNCELGPIELVISEIRLSDLLQRVCTEVKCAASRKHIKINLPRDKPPRLLADARLMQRLLVKLVANAIHHCPANGAIEISAIMRSGYCTVAVKNPLARSMSKRQLKNLYRDFRRHENLTDSAQSFASLSLARNYAERLNLELEARVLADARFCVCLSNIKIT